MGFGISLFSSKRDSLKFLARDVGIVFCLSGNREIITTWKQVQWRKINKSKLTRWALCGVSFQAKPQQQKTLYQWTTCLVTFEFVYWLKLSKLPLMLTCPVSSEYKSNGSIDIESGLETTKESQNLRKSTFVFGSVTLVVSLRTKKDGIREGDI